MRLLVIPNVARLLKGTGCKPVEHPVVGEGGILMEPTEYHHQRCHLNLPMHYHPHLIIDLARGCSSLNNTCQINPNVVLAVLILQIN